jgi:hypothetical protein
MKFVDICTSLEAGLRVVTIAPQGDTTLHCSLKDSDLMNTCLQNLAGKDGELTGCLLALHLVLGRSASRVVLQEQRQLYSVLSTVLKVAHGQAGVVHGRGWC